VAPEDDPEFIWLMEQAKRKREREARTAGDAAEGSESGAGSERGAGRDEGIEDRKPTDEA
jgi:hypothetical protein